MDEISSESSLLLESLAILQVEAMSQMTIKRI